MGPAHDTRTTVSCCKYRCMVKVKKLRRNGRRRTSRDKCKRDST